MIYLSEQEIEAVFLSKKSKKFFFNEGRKYSESSIIGLYEITNMIILHFFKIKKTNITFNDIKKYFKEHFYFQIEKNIFINHFEYKIKESFLNYAFYRNSNINKIVLIKNGIINIYNKYKYIFFYIFIIGYFYNLLKKLNIDKKKLLNMININLKLNLGI